jgi:hypothetical protein
LTQAPSITDTDNPGAVIVRINVKDERGIRDILPGINEIYKPAVSKAFDFFLMFQPHEIPTIDPAAGN